jgi:prolyl oligopeptidase
VILRINSIFAVTDEGGTKRRVVELTDDGRIIRVVVPEWEHEIHSFIIAGGHAFVSYQRDGRSIVRQWILRGNHVRTIDIPEYSSIELLSDLGANSNSLFYTIESFAKSPAIWEYRLATDDHSPWCAPSISAEDDTLRIERVSCRSTDGTEVPIFLAMSSNLKMDQAHPLILTGYGGFGVPMMPKFSLLIRIMLDLGAVFALANIRGGSEFGKPWHDSARARNRQVAFDDFIAAAEWLCATGITTPRVLAIFGGSNSGLLVGAAMTQRPDLFRAVLCIAPLLDMVRYEQFDFAKRWRHEYGSVEDPEEFAALVGYSPYHHVREDVSYPSTFFVTGDQDDRCNPAHVRKMAALLESRSAQSNPILVDYCQHRGHSPVLPVSLRIEALTRRIGFLCHELGIEIRSEAIHDSAPL